MKTAFRRIKFCLYLITVLIIVSVVGYLSLFLYKNFYQVITQSEEILALQKKVAIDTVDIEKFNEVIKKIKEKTKLEYLNKINDPFD